MATVTYVTQQWDLARSDGHNSELRPVRDSMSIPASIDATIANVGCMAKATVETNDCCLVQIYPTNIVDGLMRLGDDTLTIGREQSNDLSLVDGSVSPLSCPSRSH